ncbi:hypothetical protein [Mycobacterium sp. URHD0025]|uniref:hypothetical protein n=1 Tax=Mycobacterium sp. URHD0025 TaxID=1298864 RepID=UPI0003F943C9|nr:hypothetical protein [Mycobacterium sp. URHD0025]
MSTLTRRIAAGFTLAAAPALIALGAATAHADASVANAGPSVSSHHQAFPNQHNMPQPGSRIHHHHQHNHAK